MEIFNLGDIVFAHDIIFQRGICGEVSWKFQDGALIISGTGRMGEPLSAMS